MKWTDGVSDDQSWVRELLGDVWGKLLNRADGPSIGIVTKEVIVRIHPQKVVALARTQGSRLFRLDL